ncbi:MAG: hypothetical protein IPJ65_26755 [Archangiaceae bacterium]|nr:hypothetical protein [Archangiaceae bacterium]
MSSYDITDAGAQLLGAAEAAAALPIGLPRADAFRRGALPILLADARRQLGGDPQHLAEALRRAIDGSASSAPTLGLTRALTVDPDYAARAANATWTRFSTALGLAADDAAAVTRINAQLGGSAPAKGKFAPAFERLVHPLQRLVKNVCRAVAGEDVWLNSLEHAFKASLVLSHLTWHFTNWQLAAVDPTRTDPRQRNRIFNTWSDYVAHLHARRGLEALIDLVTADAHHAGKPGVGKAHFPTRDADDEPTLPAAQPFLAAG